MKSQIWQRSLISGFTSMELTVRLRLLTNGSDRCSPGSTALTLYLWTRTSGFMFLSTQAACCFAITLLRGRPSPLMRPTTSRFSSSPIRTRPSPSGITE